MSQTRPKSLARTFLALFRPATKPPRPRRKPDLSRLTPVQRVNRYKVRMAAIAASCNGRAGGEEELERQRLALWAEMIGPDAGPPPVVRIRPRDGLENNG